MLAKELRSLAAVMVVQLFAFGVLTLASALLTEIPDQLSLYDVYDDGDDIVFAVFLISFMIGLSQLVREHDDGTIHFLDTLPTTRTRVYLTKLAAGVVALGVTPLCWLVVSVPLAWLSRDSLDDGVHLRFAVVTALLVWATAIVAYSYGVALSSLRRFAWLVLAVATTLVVRFRADLPLLALARPTELLELRVHAGERVIPWRALALQAGLAGAAAFVGWAIFAGLADRVARGFTSLQTSLRGRAVLGGGAVLIVLAFFAMSAVWAMTERRPPAPAAELDGVVFSPRRPQTLGTRAYTFRVAADLDDDARTHIHDADRIHDGVRSWFGADAVPPISVDATATMGIAAHLGQTQWQAVSMSAFVLDDAEQFALVLAHETAHVYANVVSDRRLSEAHASTRLFHEGLATVVAEDVTQQPAGTLAAAHARKRNLVSTELLFDDAALGRRVDPALAYGLGRELVRATIDLGGADAPARVLRALARPEVPKDLRGITLMRDAYQAAGTDLDRVIERFYARLDDAVAAHAERLAAVPLTHVGVDEEDGIVRVTLFPDGDTLPPFGARCQLRARPDAPPDELIFLHADDGACALARAALPTAAAEVQAGYLVDDELLFDAWTEVRLE